MRHRRIFPLPFASLAACLLVQLMSGRADAAVTISGTVAWIHSSTEFTYQTGKPHGYVHVIYSASMVFPSGSSINKGQTVMVSGTWHAPGEIDAANVTIYSLYHIATWTFDQYGLTGQGSGASAASVNQLVTYAQGNKALVDCHSVSNGCKAMFYIDYNHPYNNTSGCMQSPDAEFVAAASESWFVHLSGYTDSAHRVYGKWINGCLIWQMNPNSSGVQAWWLNYLQKNADSYDLYFLDVDAMTVVNANFFPSGGGCSPWPSLCWSTQEMPNNAAEAQARANFVNAMSHSDGRPMYFMNNGGLLPALSATNRFFGESCEGCIANYLRPENSVNYANTLNQMAGINASPGAFLLISLGHFAAGSASQIRERLATIGIVWLAYSEGHTIVWSDLESNTNNLAIWPEDLIYPSSPVQSMVIGSTDLAVSLGVYRREFTKCYLKSVPFGACAAIVNANSYAVTIPPLWLHQTYHHVITLSGGDVLSGGVANISGASFVPGATTVEAGGAILLAP